MSKTSSNTCNIRRFQDDLETANLSPASGSKYLTVTSNNKKETANSCLKHAEIHSGNPFQDKKLSRVFSEDYEIVQKKILDPRGPVVSRWNKCFLIACLVSLFVDPLFFYLPTVKEEACMQASVPLEIALTIVRSVIDAFYMIQIFVRFRTAYVAPSSRVFGRESWFIDSSKIASRYLRKDFWLDLVSALPLPQLLIWAIIPSMRGSNVIGAKHGLRLTIIFQFLLRLYLIFPLSSKIIRTAGVVVEAAWAGAAFNLMLFMLASHLSGKKSAGKISAIFSNLSVGTPILTVKQWVTLTGDLGLRQATFPNCVVVVVNSIILEFMEMQSLTMLQCRASSTNIPIVFGGTEKSENLVTTTYIGEITFAISIAILGLVLFALLIGNMQTYLQSSTARLEEWRVRRTDTEKWMHHRQLPHHMKERVRKYDLYKWVTTRGVDEEAIMRGLPLDLRRDIKHHLCLDLVRRVPMFGEMDQCTLDAICERLKPVLCTPGTCLVREGDPVIEMLFILRGRLDSYTTNGGRTGFFNSCQLGSGDFCGEELLSWALYPRPSILLPSSTRTVNAITEVEAFALVSEDVKFVASQFRKLHSKQLKHKFRFHSHQWRTWAACFIQAAWFRYKRRKEGGVLKARENVKAPPAELALERCASLPPRASEFAIYAAQLATSIRRSGSLRNGSQMDILSALKKPVEPDFSIDDSV
ncbi:UNVERIFIED_CONTAM: protein CNGC15a [Sesamum radiatum]|uniref:Protein CNGC15a n=1 Tax=Sesamum radiatum TaxID=300843 RepID=A0AAW2KRR5_SESRA